MAGYLTARSIEEAAAAVAGGARPIAGGTDLVVASRQGKQPLPESLVGIHRIPGLGEIDETEAGLELGALVTHAEIADHPAVRAGYSALADASAIVGSRATRAHGTLGGNIMNASPAMDTGAPLLCFRAVAMLTSTAGSRHVDLAGLWAGPGSTTARPDELLVGVRLPAPPSGSAYVRLEYRRQMEIAVVGAAAALTLDGEEVTAAAIAITALAPTIHRVAEAEAALVGTAGEAEAVGQAAAAAAEAARPIDDVRGSASYRRAMAAVITRRAVEAALARARGQRVGIPASDATFGT